MSTLKFAGMALKTIFGFDGAGDAALKIVDKLAGTDWTPKERAQFILDHVAATKYQSPTRRLIAITMFFEWALLLNVWLASSIYGHVLDAPNALLLAGDIILFMGGNINMAINGILAFYFLIGMKK